MKHRYINQLFLIALVSLFAWLFAVDAHAESSTVRERLSLNADWRFQRGDPADLPANSVDYAHVKDYLLAASNHLAMTAPVVRPAGNPGAEVSYVKADFDDRGWRALSLPHDWAIEGPFNINLDGVTGKLPWEGEGWYRKHVTIPASDAGRRLFLAIDGAMSHSLIWVNGQLAGGWPYGYSSFELDITNLVKPGASNVIAIRLSNPPQSSRWYPGAGIYRNVWLIKTSPVHIAQWSTYVATVEATSESANLGFRTTITNQSQANANVQTTTVIYPLDAAGAKVGTPVATMPTIASQVAAGGQAEVEAKLSVTTPARWSLEHPNRYVAVTEVRQDGKLVDRQETPFGIRTIQFDADKGFLLNGVRVQLNGVCNHHDLGAIGTAFNVRAAERQIEILKEMGCNAIRTSHNMPAPELLDLCDRMGMLVMAEAFDCWREGKKENDYHLQFADWHERDLRAFFRRDRNHPSVIVWSLGNEMPDLGAKDRAALAGTLNAFAHQEDPFRITCVGSNNQSAWLDWKDGDQVSPGIQNGLGMYGQNYPTCDQKSSWDLYENYHAANPTKPIIGSETSSCISSRGYYVFPMTTDQGGGTNNFQVSSYDLYAPGWGCPPDREFEALDHCSFVAGEFVWTGFDYLGEPTPYSSDETNLLNFHDPEKIAALEKELKEFGKIKSPSRSSYFGIVDLCGFKKDRFYIYQAHWRPEFPMAHILPHWNWPDRVGKITPVFVYTSGDEAELFINGKSQGRRSRTAEPKRPANLALNQTATASGEENQNLANKALDGTQNTRWCAANGDKNQWWQLDLGQKQPIRTILITFESKLNNYQYVLSASDNGTNWKELAVKNDWTGELTTAIHNVNLSARYLKITFTDLAEHHYASISEVAVYNETMSVDSFLQDHYRMRWNSVVYEPGEVKVVTYKHGKPWATSSIKTTGEASALKLNADRATITGDGKDLSYITTTVVDANGAMVPTARQRITYKIMSGPGQIVATDNGDPTNLETFANPARNAFNGLALVIVRGQAGKIGDVTIRATAEGLTPAVLTVQVQ